MKSNCMFQIIIILSLLLLFIKTKDNSTLSNYEDIKLTKLSGVFVPDFERKILNGSLTYTFSPKKTGNKIILDTKYLDIISITTTDSKENISYKLDEENTDKNLGVPLVIDYDYEPDNDVMITINYTTTENGSSASFLEESLTMGGKHKYFFTISKRILGRELLPSQDTPAVKFTFELEIKVPKELRGMISGLLQKEEKNEDNITKSFYYKQDIPIPNYLIALAAGDIEGRPINDMISVFSEPSFVGKVEEELKEFLPQILNKAISYLGDYEWEKYNVLVLPNSFPYSGTENPCLTFISPCLINGDKSLVDIVAHLLIHSWSGNLVTNENWRDFWLNEGITMFLQRKIIGMWKDEDYAKMDAILGTFYIEENIDIFGINSTHTSLRPNLTDKNPDDYYSDIPYEKGYNFMYYLETLIGEKEMQNFFQSYFYYFKYKSVDFEQFQRYFLDFCENNSLTDNITEVDWYEWIYQPGYCPVENDFSNKYKTQVDEFIEKFHKEEFDDDNLKNEFNEWMHTSKTVFMNILEQEDDFLTQKQHDFLTNELQLYNDTQNFLVKTNYFRLILAKTDEFYDIEKEYLYKYLSAYGALDYMTGIYGLFYRRDEELAMETLQNLSTFYHPLMINEAEDEFEEERNNFPILTLELENNICLFLDINSKIEIKSDDYIESFGEIEILKGVYLQSEDNQSKINLICYYKSFSDRYCLTQEKNNITQNYKLIVPKRIQNQSYAIRKNEGKYIVDTYEKEIKVNRTQYDVDYKDKKEFILEIEFLSEPDKNVSIMYKDKKVNCILNNCTMKCTLNKDEFKANQNYSFDVVDKCKAEKFSFTISPKEDDKIETVAILVIIIIGLFIIVVVSFFIYRSVNKNKNVTIEQIPENKLLSDI